MGAFIDISGERFGKLVAKRISGRDKSGNALWECQCDCGNTCVASGVKLRGGRKISCGKCHSRAKDLTGHRFGRLVVTGPDGEHKAGQKIMWMCQCDCGNERSVQGRLLRNGTITSCGCAQEEARKKNIEVARAAKEQLETNPPGCRWDREDCFAYVKDTKGCRALNSTDFPGRGMCPFYKDRLQYLMENPNLKLKEYDDY